MKKTRLIAVVLSFCMLLALVPVAALAVDFTDIDDATNGSYANAIERWSDEGVISGVGNDAFNPKGNMTRVQGFGIIANLLNLTEKADLSEYTDVPTATWKADYLAKVVAAGIVTGYPDKTLRPDDELTREQMFVTIAKTLGIQPVETDDEAFEDIGDAAGYAAPYINALHKMGAVNGSNGKVNPLATLSREGAALLLDNLIGGYANADGETATIVAGKITLIVADNAKVEGTANELPIVIAGQAHIVDMRGVKGAATVIVTVPGVEIRNAPVGTKVTVTEGVTGVRVNGRTVAGGQTITVEGTSGGGTITPTTNYQYTITYHNAAGEVIKDNEKSSSGKEVVQTFKVLSDRDAGLIVSAETEEFAGWATKDGKATYAAGATYDISGDLDLYPQIIDKTDYIAMAVKGTMDKINSQVIAKIDSDDDGIGTRDSSVKIDRLAYSGVTDANNARPQTVSGSVTASADLANYIVEYACTVATTLLSNPEAAPDKSDVENVVRTVVEQLEKALEINIMRSDGIKKTAEKIFNAVKNRVDPAGAFRNMDGAYCISKMVVSINGIEEAVIKVENGQATLHLPEGKTRSEVISNVALAVAKDLYADLKTKTTPASKLELNATVDVTFNAVAGVNSKHPTKYPVTVKLTLDAGTLGQVWYNPNAKTVNEQNGAVVVKVNANTIEETYDREVREVINQAIVEMTDSFNGMLGNMVTGNGSLAGLTKAVKEFGVDGVTTDEAAEAYVKGILKTWLTTNLEGGLNSRFTNGWAQLDNSDLVDLVVTLSHAASDAIVGKLEDAKTQFIEEMRRKYPDYPDQTLESMFDVPVSATLGEKFVPFLAADSTSGNYGVEQLGGMLNLGDSISVDFDQELAEVKKLDDGIKIYIYSVITDDLKEEFRAGTTNYATQNYSGMTDGLNNLVRGQLQDKGIYQMFDTLRKVSTLKGLAGLTLSEIKRSFVDKEEIKDVVGGLGLTDSLKGYIDKIPTDRLPDEATVTFHIGNGYTLSKEDLASFKNVATRDGLAKALADLANKGPELKLNDFDVNNGVQVDVHYNSRAFTFYLWIDGLN